MTTISDLLVDGDQPDGPRHQIAEALRTLSLDVGPHLPVPILGLAATVHSILDLPVMDVALRGWRAHADVVEARRATREAPGERTVVRLAGHSITSTHRPRIDATYRGIRHPLLTLDLALDIEVAAVVLVVEGGEVVDAAPTGGRVKAKLSSSGRTLLKRTWTPFGPSAPPTPPPPPPRPASRAHPGRQLATSRAG